LIFIASLKDGDDMAAATMLFYQPSAGFDFRAVVIKAVRVTLVS
jgi:hypothetical protein